MQRPLIPPPFDETAAEFAIATGVVDVHAGPERASEVVTQALLGTPLVPLDAATAEDATDGWLAVQLPDYAGWIPASALATRAAPAARMAVVMSLRAPLFTSDEEAQPGEEIFATTALPILAISADGSRVTVALPGGRHGLLPATDCAVVPTMEPLPRRSPDKMLAFGRALLGVPYLWGGVTVRGIDCSGLAQLCYRYAGITLLRDADQQCASLPYVVERGDLRAGDLVFFARGGQMVHVGIMLDARHILHADGSVRHQVTINSLDPDGDDYSPRLAQLYAGARRPLAQPTPDEPDEPDESPERPA